MFIEKLEETQEVGDAAADPVQGSDQNHVNLSSTDIIKESLDFWRTDRVLARDAPKFVMASLRPLFAHRSFLVLEMAPESLQMGIGLAGAGPPAVGPLDFLAISDLPRSG